MPSPHPVLPSAVGAVALALLTGCGADVSGTTTAPSASVRVDELADAGGSPCPEELPLGEDPSGHGFGVEEPATQLPTLLEPEEAWVCRYDAVDEGTTASGGMVFGWRRTSPPEVVAARRLPDLRAALGDLALPDARRACTDDLGPRWMVVYAHEGDLTGVVVDGYGCRDVRLTDDPRSTPPGAPDQDGAVGGVLDGGAAVLETLGVSRA